MPYAQMQSVVVCLSHTCFNSVCATEARILTLEHSSRGRAGKLCPDKSKQRHGAKTKITTRTATAVQIKCEYSCPTHEIIGADWRWQETTSVERARYILLTVSYIGDGVGTV